MTRQLNCVLTLAFAMTALPAAARPFGITNIAVVWQNPISGAPRLPRSPTSTKRFQSRPHRLARGRPQLGPAARSRGRTRE